MSQFLQVVLLITELVLSAPSFVLFVESYNDWHLHLKQAALLLWTSTVPQQSPIPWQFLQSNFFPWYSISVYSNTGVISIISDILYIKFRK